MSTASPATKATKATSKELRVYGHSSIFYWWPIWVLGYVMALWTYWHGSRVLILPGGDLKQAANVIKVTPEGNIQFEAELEERMHESRNPGIIFTFALVFVILITNVPLRGLASAVLVTTGLAIVLLFVVMDWWEIIFSWLGKLSIHMNMGFYLFFSTVLLIVWVLVTFGFDRMTYWKVTPGQITYEYVFGGGQRSYDTEAMAFEKLRDDAFRHWILGLGSGDLIMHPFKTVAGAAEDLQVHNVLFVGKKLEQIQHMIAMSPHR